MAATTTGGDCERRGWFAALVLGVTLLKCLFVNAYHSTDFEVHRNWLAITHSLPPSRWYLESTSEWTLDYPPLFAWFECALSRLARLADADMLRLDRPGYTSPAAVLFHRLSVVGADLLFVYAAREWCGIVREEEGERGTVSSEESEDLLPSGRPFVLAVLLLWNGGLLLVDHVHFQYNGFLSAFLLLSLARHAQRRHPEGALLFAALLNLKHVYLYVSPAYGLYLLRRYCFADEEGVRWKSFRPLRLGALAAIVLSVTGASFGPFAAAGQMPQVLSRLFPFEERGLCHAYWAPNFWALYNALDKVLVVVGARLNLLDVSSLPKASMTGGLVQGGRESPRHAVLPSVSPAAALVLTLLSVLPAALRTWLKPRDEGSRDLVSCVVLCALGSFTFAWHVHEKAILMAVLPMTLLAVESREDAGIYLVLAITANCSLSPLIFTPAELPIKALLMAAFAVYSVAALRRLHVSDRVGPGVLGPLERVYLWGLLAVEVFREIVYPLLSPWKRTLPFLPLMVTSVYCSLGIVYSFVRLYLRYLLNNDICTGDPPP